MEYTVSEVAKILGMAPSAIRYYDKEGLLPFVKRSESGNRIFTEEDFRWLNLITCLKHAGMQLKDIRSYIQMSMEGDETIDERYQMFIRQREILQGQIAQLQETLDVVEYKCWFYETAKETGSADVPRRMEDEEIPERFRQVRRKLRATV